MRILVLGGTQFIGPPLVAELIRAGHEVTVFHRGLTETHLPPQARHLHGDWTHLERHRAELCETNPEAVILMRAMTERDARQAVETFRGAAGRMVALSSCDVYRAYGRLIQTEPGPPDPVPLAEESPLRERLHPYRGAQLRSPDDPGRWMDDYDKIPVERAVLGQPDLPGTILRLPMVYGSGDNQHRLFEYLKRMDDKRPAIILGERTARWRAPRGYVENVAAAIAQAAADERAAGRIYNVAEAEARPEIEWVREIARVAGWSGRVVTLPDGKLPKHLAEDGDLAQDLAVDSTRIRRELGYTEITPREEALARTIAWERANPPSNHDPARFDYAAEDEVLEMGHR